MFDLEETTQKLLAHPYFEKAKKVREISEAHKEDSVYTHLMQTYDTARESIDGNFINDPQAKQLFDAFMHKEIEGITYANIAPIVAMVHDIGKILSFKEDKQSFPMNIRMPHGITGNTYNPGHEYWGSTVIPELLKDLVLPKGVVEHVATIVRLHGHVFDSYSLISQFPIEEAIRDVKSRVENYHLEVLFNSYCDLAYNNPRHSCRELIVKIFNHPDIYMPREYFVALV